MPVGKQKTTPDRSATEDLWRKTLRHIPSVVGRLAYLAQLRNPNSGRYEHHGLAAVVGRNNAEKALKTSHLAIFDEWIQFSLREQQSELELYFSGLEESKKEVVESWMLSESFMNLVPATAHSAARHVFAADMRALLEILRNVTGGAEPDPED
jgi:hypothetical protein